MLVAAGPTRLDVNGLLKFKDIVFNIAFFTWAGKPYHCKILGWKAFLTWAGKPYHCKILGWKAFVTWAGKPYHSRILGWKALSL